VVQELKGPQEHDYTQAKLSQGQVDSSLRQGWHLSLFDFLLRAIGCFFKFNSATAVVIIPYGS
jgi:hypothetical protein